MKQQENQAFNRIFFTDGQVVQIKTYEGELHLQCIDWQGNPFNVIFCDVIGFEVFSIEGEDLSHGMVSATNQFIKRVSTIVQETSEGLWCFEIWSAWTDEPRMRVVARSFRID